MKQPIYDILVVGKPRTQGSMKAFTVKGTNRAVVVQGKAPKDWRDAIIAQMTTNRPPRQPKGTAVKLSLTFYLPMSDAMYHALGVAWRKNQKGKAGRPGDLFPINKRDGDDDKLLRAVQDALTSWAYDDDCQVSTCMIRKRFTRDRPGGHIRVWLDELKDEERALYETEWSG